MKLERTKSEVVFHSDVTDLAELSEWRGISVETLEMAQIHVTDDGWWGIPYPNLSGFWYVRKRNPNPDGKPKYLSGEGEAPHLYNPLGLGPNADEVWFCEGEFDTLALIDAGVPAVGYPGVSTITEHDPESEDQEAPRRFKAEWRLLYLGAFVVAAGDMDSDGKRAIRQILRAFSPKSAHFEVNDDKDVNDWWKRDPAGMLAAIEEFRREHRLD